MPPITDYSLSIPGPAAVRYPAVRVQVLSLNLFDSCRGRQRFTCRGNKVAILNFGTLLADALVAADALDASVWICAL